MDPNQDTSVDQEHSHIRSWRPPTPPPPPTTTTTTISSLTDKIMDEQKKTPWGVKTFFKKDNQHHHNKLEQNHSDDDDDDDDSNIHFRSTGTADIFDQEPMDSLLLTEEGKDDDDDDHNYNNSNLTQTSTMTNNLLQGTTKKKTTLFENLQRKQRPQTKDSPPEDDQLSTKYQMMKSQHGIISSTLTSSFDEEQQHDVSFFYNGMDDLEVTRYRQERNATNWNHARNLQQESTNYFDHSLRRDFVQAHAFLNAFIANENNSITDDDDDNDEETFDDNDDYMDFSTLFSFGCSPSSRQRHVDSEKDNRLPAIADIRKSSLSYFHKGRVQMRLPTDHIRLAMDEYLEPGILIVERPLMQSEMDPTSRTHVDQRNGSLSDENTSDAHMPLLENSHQDDEVLQSDTIRSMRNTDTNMNVKLPLLGDDQDDIEQQNLEPLNYILTVDQNIYKRLLADISSSRMPCGFYYCCHDTVDHSKNVHIGVAIAILSVVFTFLFVATCIWPLD